MPFRILFSKIGAKHGICDDTAACQLDILITEFETGFNTDLSSHSRKIE